MRPLKRHETLETPDRYAQTVHRAYKTATSRHNATERRNITREWPLGSPYRRSR